MSATITSNLLRLKNFAPAATTSAMVKGKNKEGQPWTESTELINVSRTGAGFYLEEQCHIGQLVSLMIPMPRNLRCYDREKELYRVWGLVQHSYLVSGESKHSNQYHVGIAFIGKHVPESYHQNKFQSYRIVGINQDGLWKVIETQAPFVTRRYQRFQIASEVVLQVMDKKGRVFAEEKTVTENISQRGAALFSELDVCVGECIRFDCRDLNFTVLAVVRSHKYIDHGVRRLHLEFIDDDFPIRDVDFSAARSAELENAAEEAGHDEFVTKADDE
jgi:hypothetical protein